MFHGVINIYKEQGYTSHDVVAKLRGILKQKKIGHTGTLDPAAEGVLPVCLGKGTKLCDMLTDKTKTYQTVLLLGVVTDTQDTTGTILRRGSTEALTEKQVREAAESFVGLYDQIPPMYSALKVGGKKLYELAREGKEIERQARPVEIFSLTIDKIDLPRVTMTVHCSKGTYIRTLCHDIGEKLGCGGCMEYLLRTQVDRFLLKDSLTLSQVEESVKTGSVEKLIFPVDEMFSSFPAFVSEDKNLDRLLANGNFFLKSQANGRIEKEGNGRKSESIRKESESEKLNGDIQESKDGDLRRVYDSARRFIGVYEYRAMEQKWKPKKIFLGGE